MDFLRSRQVFTIQKSDQANKDLGNSLLPVIYARPLIPILLALMGGITACLYWPRLSSTFLAFCLVLFSSIFFVFKRQNVRVLPLILFFFLGYWSLLGWTAPRLPVNHVSHFIDGESWHIIGSLDGPAQRLPDRTRFTLTVESLTRNQKAYEVSGAIRVTVRAKMDNLRDGDRIGCLARLKEIRNFNNPGGFDYQRYMIFRGIWASAFVSKEDHVVRLHAADTMWPRRGLERSRRAVSELIERACPHEVRGVLKALLIADKSEISPEIREVFNRTGIAHVLAISGLHIGMVATVAFFVFRFLLARFQRVLLAGWVTRGAAVMSALPVLFYGLLAGMSPATQRAVIMVMVFLLALLFERERDTMNTLAVAALVILIINPTALFEISFQLSFVAVFAILYALEHLAVVPRLSSRPRTLAKRLALFLFISAAAILGTLPLTLYYFNQTSLIGIFANCLMVPLVGFLVVQLGLLAVLLLPIIDIGAFWVMKAAAVAMQGGLAVAVPFSRYSFSAVKTVTPTLIEIGLYYALAWALFNFRRTRLTKVMLIGIAVLVVADAAYWANQRFGNQELRVTVMDVGQSSAVLLELPGGSCMLVDGGGFYGNRFDVGARVVAPVLWRKKIATVQTLVLSHPDPDHLNGLLFIAKHFNVKEVWMNHEHADSESYGDFLDIISEKGIRILQLEELLRPKAMNGVKFQCLYPPKDFLAKKEQDLWRNTNNNSVVLKVSFDKISFLFPGDIGTEAEKELTGLAAGALKSDVLLVPHHGSKHSSSPGFLRYVDPSIAVISAGWKNIFGFPHHKVLKRYEDLGCQIFRTDQHGAITITTDGEHVKVRTHSS